VAATLESEGAALIFGKIELQRELRNFSLTKSSGWSRLVLPFKRSEAVLETRLWMAISFGAGFDVWAADYLDHFANANQNQFPALLRRRKEPKEVTGHR
jgi:hypothetical protein